MVSGEARFKAIFVKSLFSGPSNAKIKHLLKGVKS
jgi:hypothetical protein